MDEHLEQFVMLAVQRLQTAESKHLKCLLVTVVANGLYYNASLCLQVCGFPTFYPGMERRHTPKGRHTQK
jgi:hypothetical protein